MRRRHQRPRSPRDAHPARLSPGEGASRKGASTHWSRGCCDPERCDADRSAPGAGLPITSICRKRPFAIHEARLDDTYWPATSALIDEACGLTGSRRRLALGQPARGATIRVERVDLVKERWNFEEQRTSRRHALAPPAVPLRRLRPRLTCTGRRARRLSGV